MKTMSIVRKILVLVRYFLPETSEFQAVWAGKKLSKFSNWFEFKLIGILSKMMWLSMIQLSSILVIVSYSFSQKIKDSFVVLRTIF